MPTQDDEYELMPRTELEYLRKEVEKLKRNPLGDTQASITLLESINKLNANIVRMNEILSSANDDMVKAFGDASIQSQLVKVAEQQEKLAKGIVAVSELVKRIETERAAPLPSIDTMLPRPASALPAAPAALAPLPEAEPMQQRNPFEQRQAFNPIMTEPLPRPAPSMSSSMSSSDLRMPLPPPLPGGQQAAPNPSMGGPNPFIPDADIPPPPPRRR